MLVGFFFIGLIFFPASAHATTWDDHAELTAVANGNTTNPVRIKASHITQMRNVVNDDLRNSVACGSLPDLTWRTLTGTPMEADDINTIKIEIDDPRYNVPQPLIDAINVTIGTPIRASDILKVRAAIDAAACSAGPCVPGPNCNCNSVCDNPPENCDTCLDCACTAPDTCQAGVCVAPSGCNIFPGTMSLCNASECCLPDMANGPPYEVCVVAACVPANQAATCIGLPSVDTCGAANPVCPGTMNCGVPCHTATEVDMTCAVGEFCCTDPGGVPDLVHGGTYNFCGATCPTCTDTVQNGDETGVDCGGSICPACGPPIQNYSISETSPGGRWTISGLCSVTGYVFPPGNFVTPDYVLERDAATEADAVARGVTHAVVTAERYTDNGTPCHRYLVADFYPGQLQVAAAFNDSYSVIDFTCGGGSNACSESFDGAVTVQEYF